jgi:DnaJ-class molecular chaperone
MIGDPDRRQVYDLYGEEGLKEGHRFNIKRGPDYKYFINVTLEEIYSGLQKDVIVKRNEVCRSCTGTGAENAKLQTCTKCDGRGQTIETFRNGWGQSWQEWVTCSKCNGKGNTIPKKCTDCKGKGV